MAATGLGLLYLIFINDVTYEDKSKTETETEGTLSGKKKGKVLDWLCQSTNLNPTKHDFSS